MAEQKEIKLEIQPYSPPPAIMFNYEEILSAVKQRAEELSHVVVTKDTFKDCKALKSDINKVSKELDSKRIEIKKEYSKSLTKFEDEVKEINSVIKETSQKIDVQIKVIEEEELKHKKAKLTLVYGENIGNLLEIVSLDSILNPKWENAGEKVEKLSEEIKDSINKIHNELDLIDNFGSDFTLNCKDVYIKSGYDLSKAMAEKVRIEQRKKELEELERKDQEAKVQREAARKAEEERKAAEAQKLAEMSEPAKDPEPIQNTEPEKPVSAPIQNNVPTTLRPEIRDVMVKFFDTTPAFRSDMAALLKKHNIQCAALKNKGDK